MPSLFRIITAAAGLGLFLAPAIHQATAATYYLDGANGADGRDGMAPERAWRSLDQINNHEFQPGDQIRIKAGTRYAGQLKLRGSGRMDGTNVVPIVIGRYGEGAMPRIDGGGQVLDTVLIQNAEFWEVEDLEITNEGETRAPWRTGVHLLSDNFGTMRHIHLRNLFVHDVNGDLAKEREGCGIYFESRGGQQSRFDGLLIENCRVTRADRNGICQRNGSRARSTGVVIRNNVLEDIGGDVIKAWGSNGPLIEHNIVRGGRMRCDDYAAGIWAFDCDDAVIQFNEVSGMKGTKDGQGFDADYRCRRSIFQYNYSHDNDGGFILICSPGNSYNTDTVIRYNISRNDGINSARVFHFGGAAKETLVYNNTIYVGTNQELPLLLFDEWNRGHADGVKFFNNIFYVDGKVTYKWGQSTNLVFESNVFYGNHNAIPPGTRATTNRPPLIDAGAGGEGIESLKGCYLAGRPEFMMGRIIANNGGRDFFGNHVPENEPPAIGAAEFQR